MKKNDQDNLQDDLKYFQKAMEGVRPLIIRDTEAKIIFEKNIKKTSLLKSQSKSNLDLYLDSKSELKPYANLEDINSKNISSEEKLFFTRQGGGLQHSILQKLKQGKIKIDKVLDLHGMTVNQASINIEKFIKTSITQNCRYILIIHGKGKFSQDMPTLKNHLYHWLIQMPTVLAFCSATPKDGGTGAVYVVLKKFPF